jgi:hypothetical protein
MSQQRMQLWAAEADIDEDVDLNLAIGSYGQSDRYDDGAFFKVYQPFSFNANCCSSSHPATSDR